MFYLNVQNHIAAIVYLFLIYFTSYQAVAQGCSDAGFCTMGAMKPDQHFSNKIKLRLRSIEFSHYLGLTKFDNRILAYTVDFNIGFNDKTTLQVKLPYQYAEGRLGSNHGLGDISLSLSYNLINKEQFQVNATLGTKLPTGVPNRASTSGRALPMYYQNTLGTYDFIAGISLITRNWLIATGYQRALNQVNSQFLWRDWQGTPNQIWSDHYPQANQLLRGDDVMLRVEYNLRFSRFNANTGLLAIYRPTQDQIKVGERTISVKGSDGLALTYLVGLGYKFNVRSAIKIGAGFRLRRRARNPDGLSREFVNTITYQFNF
ncbi:MAG TPA: hypothetical protein DCS93_17815 [Microscillaceae bacterium]|nr:hypothetical protein [Microscillaceae bacterium]